MAIIDTSVLVPLFDADHPQHHDAQRLAREHNPWHISGGVLSEFTRVVRRLTNLRGEDGNQAARRALAVLEEYAGYRPLADYDAALASRIFRMDDGMSYVDAWGIALSYARSEPLLTLDRRQRSILKRIR